MAGLGDTIETMSVIIILVLIIVSVLFSAMSAAYATLSTPHLRHWARKKDPAASKLYPLKARGSASLLMIELLRALSVSASLVLFASSAGSWAAWAAITVVLFLGHIVIAQLYLKSFGMLLLVWLSAPLLSLTNALKPLTWPLGRTLDRYLREEPVTLTRSELKHMLDSVSAEDTDLSDDEVRILSRVLGFANKTVHDVMTPKNKVVSVSIDETLSPVILDELHKSGHERFPVMAEDGKTVVGTLNMHDLMDVKHERGVHGLMQDKIYFVDEDRDLDHVLQNFYKTKQSVFVVHNEASDMVGIISIEDVVQEILGKPSKAPKPPKEESPEHNEEKPAEPSEELAPMVK